MMTAALWTGAAYLCIGGAFALALWMFEQAGQAVAADGVARMDAVDAADALLTDADTGREHAAVTVTVYELPGQVEACGGVFTREEIDRLARVRHRGAVVARRRAMTVQEAR